LVAKIQQKQNITHPSCHFIKHLADRVHQIGKKDDKVDSILNQLHEKGLKTPDLGLRAFSWNIEKMI
jgi:hypothetical protein